MGLEDEIRAYAHAPSALPRLEAERWCDEIATLRKRVEELEGALKKIMGENRYETVQEIARAALEEE